MTGQASGNRSTPTTGSPDRKPSPYTYRLLFLLSALLVSAVVWGIYWVSIRAVERSATESLAKRISADTVILEDHFTRSIDVVTSVLRSASTLDDQGRLLNPSVGPEILTSLIIDVPIVRSLSLVDGSGRVVASSSPRNVGIVLDSADLPTLTRPLQSDEVKFGEVFALRDLHELNSDRSPVDIGFWTALRSTQIDGSEHRWLIAINLGVFLNLWSEIDTDESTTILLVDESGKRVIDHHLTQSTLATRAIDAVLDRLPDARHGSLELPDGDVQVAFQGSSAYPAAVIVTGDPSMLPIMAAGPRGRFIALAASANALLLGFILLLFLSYLRYERRSQELANQSRAIDMHLMVAELDRDGQVVSGNKAFFEFNGYAPEELIGQSYTALSTAQRSAEARDAVWAMLRSGKPWTGTLRNRKKSGELYWVNVSIVPFLDVWGYPERLVTLMTDVTESVALSEAVAREKQLRDELARSNAALASDANTDPLTGIPNKRSFDIFAEEARASSMRDGKPFSLLMIDVDHFKQINDSRGHAVGDVVLQTLARRWARELRGSDMLARIGGEEFCVVLPRTGADATRRIAEKLRAVIAAVPVDTDPEAEGGEDIAVTVSIGAATAVEPSSATVDALLERADVALYTAKANGRNQVAVAIDA